MLRIVITSRKDGCQINYNCGENSFCCNTFSVGTLRNKGNEKKLHNCSRFRKQGDEHMYKRRLEND